MRFKIGKKQSMVASNQIYFVPDTFVTGKPGKEGWMFPTNTITNECLWA
jgi:hypothetical protein